MCVCVWVWGKHIKLIKIKYQRDAVLRGKCNAICFYFVSDQWKNCNAPVRYVYTRLNKWRVIMKPVMSAASF